MRATGNNVPPAKDRISIGTIRRYVDQLVDQFQPEKIILFGSYAYGVPHRDSDIDLLVVMSSNRPRSQALKIRLAIPAPFPLDLLVRTPREMEQRLSEGNSFIHEIVTQGQVLYEKDNQGMGKKSRRRLSFSPATAHRSSAIA